jgi:hypothetical protein
MPPAVILRGRRFIFQKSSIMYVASCIIPHFGTYHLNPGWIYHGDILMFDVPYTGVSVASIESVAIVGRHEVFFMSLNYQFIA